MRRWELFGEATPGTSGAFLDEAIRKTILIVVGQPRIEIVSDRRRRHDDAFVSEVLAACSVPGVAIREVADRYGNCVSLIYHWRRRGRLEVVGASSDSTVRLFPIRIAPDASPSLATASPPTGRSGVIEIERAGDVRVRVDETVNSAALRRVMAVLRR